MRASGLARACPWSDRHDNDHPYAAGLVTVPRVDLHSRGLCGQETRRPVGHYADCWPHPTDYLPDVGRERRCEWRAVDAVSVVMPMKDTPAPPMYCTSCQERRPTYD